MQEIHGNIRVICRVRPLLLHEQKNRKAASHILVHGSNKLIVHGSKNSNFNKSYILDRILDQKSSQ